MCNISFGLAGQPETDSHTSEDSDLVPIDIDADDDYSNLTSIWLKQDKSDEASLDFEADEMKLTQLPLPKFSATVDRNLQEGNSAEVWEMVKTPFIF